MKNYVQYWKYRRVSLYYSFKRSVKTWILPSARLRFPIPDPKYYQTGSRALKDLCVCLCVCSSSVRALNFNSWTLSWSTVECESTFTCCESECKWMAGLSSLLSVASSLPISIPLAECPSDGGPAGQCQHQKKKKEKNTPLCNLLSAWTLQRRGTREQQQLIRVELQRPNRQLQKKETRMSVVIGVGV